MNHRPSTSILSMIELPAHQRSARSLRRRLLVCRRRVLPLWSSPAVAYAGLYVLKRSMAGDEDARIVNAASLSKQLVERVLAERVRQVELIASAPSVDRRREERRRGIAPARPAERCRFRQLEQLFKATRSQQVDDSARSFLSDLLPKLDIAEMMVTDQYGFNAVTTSLVVRLRAKRRGVVADGVDGRA